MIVCIIHGFGLLSALLFLEYYIFRLGKLILVSYQYSLFKQYNTVLHLERVRQAAGASDCRASCFLPQSTEASFGKFTSFILDFIHWWLSRKTGMLCTTLTLWAVFLWQFRGSNESTSVYTVHEAFFWYSVYVAWSGAHLYVFWALLFFVLLLTITTIKYLYVYFLILNLIDLQGISLD